MAEDIDIEEHDVLDHPSLRDIFPDMSIIKQEIATYDEPGVSGAFEKKDIDFSIDVKVDIKSEDDAESIDTDDDEDSDAVMVGTDVNQSDYEDFFRMKVDQERSYNVDIDLNDSKPYLQASGRFCVHCSILFSDTKSYKSHVSTQHLSFTNEPQRGRKWKVVNRKRKTYTFKNAKQTFNRDYINAQSERLIQRMIADFETGKDKHEESLPFVSINRRCFHCKKNFTTQKTLIEHLHQVLFAHRKQKKLHTLRKIESNKNISTLQNYVPLGNQLHSTTDFLKEKKSTSVQNINKPSDTSIKKSIQKESAENNEMVSAEDNNSSDSETKSIVGEDHHDNGANSKTKRYYQCHICSSYQLNRCHIMQHLNKVHDVNEIDLIEYRKRRTYFKTKCQYCENQFATPRFYNNHLYWRHDYFFFGQKLPGASSYKQTSATSNQNETGTKERESLNTQDSRTYYKCSCPLYFPYRSLFLRHLERMHKNSSLNIHEYSKTIFNPVCDDCSSSFSTASEFNGHIYNYHKKELGLHLENDTAKSACKDATPSKSNLNSGIKQLEKINNVHKNKLYKCCICSCFMVSYALCLKHMNKNHGFANASIKNNPNLFEIAAFEPKCKHCGSLRNNPKKMHLHIAAVHKRLYVKRYQNYERFNVAGKSKENAVYKSDVISKKQRKRRMSYKCTICSYYALTYEQCLKHLAQNHKVVEDTIKHGFAEEMPFNPKCKHCGCKKNNTRKLTMHMRHCHSDHFYKHYKNHDETNKNEKDKPKLYSCYICSYYLNTPDSYKRHLALSHNITDVTEITNPEVFETSGFDGTCKYCSQIFYETKEYNLHILHSHKTELDKISQSNSKNEDIEMLSNQSREKNNASDDDMSECLNTEDDMNVEEIHQMSPLDLVTLEKSSKAEFSNNFISKEGQNNEVALPTDKNQQIVSKNILVFLKSVLFQCLKCDIMFLSSTIAKKHSNHPEMLINWKCAVCKYIFKQEDRELHEKQHMFSETFTIHGLYPDDSSMVLFNCSKCAVHFDEDSFFKHFVTCDARTSNSSNCEVCDILISDEISQIHNLSHVNDGLKAFDFEIIYSDIVKFETCESQKEIEIPKTLTKIKRKKYRSRQNAFNLYRCGTCKCFTHGVRTKIHKRQLCGFNFPKRVCRQCGLVFSISSYAKHQFLHNTLKDLNLNHFTFYDYRSQKIAPPLPEFKQCAKCRVRFINNFGSEGDDHKCNLIYKTCRECTLDYDLEAFELDQMYHEYFEENTVASKKDTANEIIQRKPIVKETEPKTKPILDSAETDFQQLLKNAEMANDVVNNFQNHETEHLLFQCKDCLLTVDTYDHLIQHCQEHFINIECKFAGQKCQICYLLIDIKCYENHMALHQKHNINNFFTVLNVDIFYFTSNNKVWTNHVFRALSKDEKKTVLQGSIYNQECRIKMHLVHKGDTEFTVYGCNRCLLCVDETSLFLHTQNSCFKMRKHECSFCSIPFNSDEARLSHEKIHKTSKLTQKSFRIISFNREADMEANDVLFRRSKYFALYLCRYCGVVVDKSQTGYHRCHRPDVIKCSTCFLHLNGEYINSHLERHKYIRNFMVGKIKLILFGDRGDNSRALYHEFVREHNGCVFDYTYYMCSKCELCAKKKKGVLSQHFEKCSKDVTNKGKYQCSSCKYSFISSLKAHIREHYSDLDFVRSNMRIKILNPLQKNIFKQRIKDSDVRFESKQDKINVEESKKETVLSTDVVLDTRDHSIDPNSTSLNAGICSEKKTQATVTQNENETNISYAEQAHDEKSREERTVTECYVVQTTTKQSQNNIEFAVSCDGTDSETRHTQEHKISESDEANSVKTHKKDKSTDSCTRIYKCKCGLHFLDQSTVLIHSKNCNPQNINYRIPRHNCPKCHLLFTPKILFSHLIMHHGDKKQYKADIIDMSKEKVVVSVCLKCEHAELRVNNPEQRECTKCRHILQTTIPIELYNQPNKAKD